MDELGKRMNLEFHPIAETFPLMLGNDLDDLKADIAENGQHDPICLYEGKILDGRNRYRACLEANIEPQVEDYSGNEPLSFVISKNLKRRHLTYDQRVGIALKVRGPLTEEAAKRQKTTLKRGDKSPDSAKSRERGKSADKAAKQVKVGTRAVEEMLAEQKYNPRIADDLIAGKTTVQQARKEQRRRKQTKMYQEALRAMEGVKGKWAVTDYQDVIQCHALITDPPYGVLNQDWEPSELEPFTRNWLTLWNRCGSDTILCFWSHRYLWEGRSWFDECLSEYRFQHLLSWYYPNNNKPQSRIDFKHTWEPIFFYRKQNCQRVVLPAGYDWGNGLNSFDHHEAAVPQSNFKGQDMKQHPAQKPVSVFRWLINAVTEPGEIVCDPFCGSGTSGIAATELHRIYWGIETNAEYREMARGRIATYGNENR